MDWTEISVLLTLVVLLTVPGWAFLSVTRLWHRWSSIQRWIVAIAISICFYPILFYFFRLIFPSVSLGERKIYILLLLLLIIIVWFQRKSWKSHFSFETLDLIAILVFAATLFTRIWVAHLQPYPAWSDSLHHTLITELVAQRGQLPYTLDPYEAVSLNMYHLGLYSISGLVEIITKAPAYTSLLWTAQILNGLCGLSIFFVLDRLGSRKGAVVGALVVGLLSFQPAWYVNWGRFTQVASQTILLIAWLVTWEAMRYWRVSQEKNCTEQVGLILAASILNAGVFLLHFRVAGLYLPLLVIAGLYELFTGFREKKILSFLIPLFAVGIVSLLLVLPVLMPALKVYIQNYGTSTGISADPATTAITVREYYEDPSGSLYNLGIQGWLFVLFIIFTVVGLISFDKLTLSMLLWLASLWLIGHAYKLNLFWLTIMNYAGIVIMFYLPLSVVIGRGCGFLIDRFSFLKHASVQKAMLVILLVAVFVSSHVRVAALEESRFFVTPSDIKAMYWIRSNLPKNAVFAITTYNWLGNSPHGVDAGFWIPYFTGRKTTTGTMLFSLGTQDYIDWVLKTTSLVIQLNNDASIDRKTKELCNLGVHYLYAGKITPITQQSFDIKKLSELPSVSVLYDQEGVYILQLCR